jgi:hypothetical protein
MHSENLSNWVEAFRADFVLEFVEPQAAIVTAHPSVATAMNGSLDPPPNDLFAIVLHASPSTIVGSTKRCTRQRITPA